MAQLLRMPEISANMTEAVLNDWPVAENAAFAAGDPIATVETDKAVVDVPADEDGVLVRVLVEPGRSVTVGAPLAVLAAPGEVIDDLDALVARLTGDEPAPAAAGDGGPAQEAPAPRVNGQPVGRIFASPLARRIARENGLALGDLHGTGPGGRILRDDVRRAIADRTTRAASAAEKASDGSEKRVTPEAPTGAGEAAKEGVAGAEGLVGLPASSPAGPVGLPASGVATPDKAATSPASAGDGVADGYRDVPHSRMRRAIAARLTESVRTAPVFSIRGSARVDALLALRRELNEATEDRVSLNDLIVAAAARAHVAVPEMNVIWLDDAVRVFDDVDIAVAVATDAGLVTPVLRGVQRRTISALARAGADVVARARDGKLRQNELEGGTLTVTNLGVFGTEDFTAVINPPQAAILAVGAAGPEPVATDGQLGVATVLRVTLSVDHRPVDGATAARWMAAFIALLEAPLRILA